MKTVVFQTLRLERRVDLPVLQELAQRKGIFCYAEQDNRFLVLRPSAELSLIVFSNGTIRVVNRSLHANKGAVQECLQLIRRAH